MQEKSNKLPFIKERILYILEIKGVIKESFFNKIGMTYGNFTGKAKETPLNSNAIGNILSIFSDINPDWLILGKGSMLREVIIDEKTEDNKDIPVVEASSISYIVDRLEALAVENAFLKKENEDLKQSLGKVIDPIPYPHTPQTLITSLAAEPAHK